MKPVTLELLKTFKDISIPFVFDWSGSIYNIRLVFNENISISINLTYKILISIEPSSHSFLMEHNLKEVDFFNLASKLNNLVDKIPREDFSRLYKGYLIKAIDNNIYLTDDYHHDLKFVDLSTSVFPKSFNARKIDC